MRLIEIYKAIAMANKIDDPRFSIIHGPFSNIEHYINELGLSGKVDGVLMGGGVSSRN